MFDYWISMKKWTVRPNTVRNYTERYERNIDPVIGKLATLWNNLEVHKEIEKIVASLKVV